MTTSDHPHIVQSFDGELRQLEQLIYKLAGLDREQFSSSVQALIAGDVNAAQAVVERDQLADELEQQIEAACIRLLALRQPAADDLRLVFAAIRAASDLERVGDYAKNIAKRVRSIGEARRPEGMRTIPRLAAMADETLRMAAEAFLHHDAPLAKQAWESDRELDEAYTAFFREMLTYMVEDPRDITVGTHLLFIAKNIERIGDHATNLAEMASFLSLGQRLGSDRPKGDTSTDPAVDED